MHQENVHHEAEHNEVNEPTQTSEPVQKSVMKPRKRKLILEDEEEGPSNPAPAPAPKV